MNIESIALTLLLTICTAMVITAVCILIGVAIKGMRQKRREDRIRRLNLLRQIRERTDKRNINNKGYRKKSGEEM